MPLRRELKVTFQKPIKTTNLDDSGEEIPSIDYSELVRETTTTLTESAERILKTTIIGVGALIAMQTLREVIVKATPQG